MPQGFLGTDKSNTELKSSLRSSFRSARQDANYNAHTNASSHPNSPPNPEWTSTSADGKTLFIPTLDFSESALKEERAQYNITLKVFFLPAQQKSAREAHVRKAIDLVLQELHIPNVDLLIVQFPDIFFDDETEECPDKIKTRGPRQADPESLESLVDTWTVLEKLQEEGLVLRLGVSEFGAERLAPFLDKVRIQPSVDQISLRDCCSVPRPLTTLAKEKKIELLVHNDIVNILPRGTLRELLNEQDLERIGGDIEPQWVVKYTAVIKNRGVVENKGYFACAKYHE